MKLWTVKPLTICPDVLTLHIVVNLNATATGSHEPNEGLHSHEQISWISMIILNNLYANDTTTMVRYKFYVWLWNVQERSFLNVYRIRCVELVFTNLFPVKFLFPWIIQEARYVITWRVVLELGGADAPFPNANTTICAMLLITHDCHSRAVFLWPSPVNLYHYFFYSTLNVCTA